MILREKIKLKDMMKNSKYSGHQMN